MNKSTKQKPHLVVHVLRALGLRIPIPVLRLRVALLRAVARLRLRIAALGLRVPTLRAPEGLTLRLRLEAAVAVRIVVVRGPRHAAAVKPVAAAVVRAALPPGNILSVVVRISHVAGPVVVPEIAPSLVEVPLGLAEGRPPQPVLRGAAAPSRSRQLHQRRFQVRESALGEAILRLHVREQGVPQRILGQHARVAEQDQTVPRACESDVQPPRIAQEANTLVLVRPHTAQNNHVLLAALERVHGRHLHVFISRGRQRPRTFQVMAHVGPLAFIRRDHAQLVRLQARLQEMRRDSFNSGGLGSIQERRPRRRQLFTPRTIIKHHRRVAVRPGEGLALRFDGLGARDRIRSREPVGPPLVRGHAVLELALVEHVRRELTERGVAPVLRF
mmetsp:Transcript_1632/g.4614  ORF Transcript_1632/g.4614 Transcript_1632/m.4614 type:complete len:387 (+) Transcript_1632:158-1318(+)